MKRTRASKKEREVGRVYCVECGEIDEPHKHCASDNCIRWTDGVNLKCDDCLLSESQSSPQKTRTKMKKFNGKKIYTVCLWTRLEKYVKVEAESAEQAVELAVESDDNHFSICNYCNNEQELTERTGEGMVID